MHNEVITWDALLMTKSTENNQSRTVWERKQFTAPDSKDTAYAVAVKLFEADDPGSPEYVSVKNVIRIGMGIDAQMKFRPGDVLIYTNHDKFAEFVGQVALVEEQMFSDAGQDQVLVRWVNPVTYQGIPADRSKFPARSFERLPINVTSWTNQATTIK